MNGRFARALFAVYTNVAPATSLERFHRWYFELHRPDSLELGLFERSLRYEAASPSRVRFLTLWEADDASLDAALSRVRPGALSLRERGRVWPVQEVVFSQFLFLEAAGEPGDVASDRPPPAITTLQNDWRAPSPGVGFARWSAGALPDAAALRGAYAASAGYAAPPDDDPTARRCLWVGESALDPAALAPLWRGRAEPALAPFGRPTPIFPPPPGPAQAEPEPSASPGAPGAAWVVHWRPVAAPGSSPARY